MINAVVVACCLVCFLVTGVEGFWKPSLIVNSVDKPGYQQSDSQRSKKSYQIPEDSAKIGAPDERISLGSLKVSTIGVGTISWFKDGDSPAAKKADIEKLINYSVASGCNFFDTAERYGSDAREAMGAGWGSAEKMFQTPIKQSKIAVATKFTPSPWRCSAKDVVKACQNSCERLGVESIDLYQIHMPDIVQPLKPFGISKAKDQIYWEGLAECYARGIAKNIGVSNYGSTLLLKAAEKFSGWGIPLASNQINYSLIYQSPSVRKTIETANELGIRTIAYFPLAMGLLTGKYAKQFQDSNDIYHDSSKTYIEKFELENRYSAILPLLLVLKRIADQRDKTITQVALNWIMSQGVIPIPGARNLMQLKENLGAKGWRLSEREINELEDAASEVKVEFDGAGFKRSNQKFVGYGLESWSME
jgi:pyridoxine 4-dehydrogenase|eukprot:gene2743-2920_t